MTQPHPTRILVSDFDGTLTQHDFYDLVRRRWPVPPDDDPWVHYTAGRTTHFEALAEIFARIRTDERSLLELVDEMHLDPALPHALGQLRSHGWKVVIASAGCEWYIHYLLHQAKVEIEVNANHGEFIPTRGLLMKLPTESPYFSRQNGIDKASVVRAHLNQNLQVAFAGDGRPDLEAALLVPPDRRFARGWLAEALRVKAESFHPFTKWSEIPPILLRT